MSQVKKILIAEDELLIAKVLRMQLENLGYEVENVVDANQAIEMAQQMRPDVIILDVYLKNKTTGIEVGLGLRELGINTPMIFITGNSYHDTIELIQGINRTMVLSKPVEFDKLILYINEFF